MERIYILGNSKLLEELGGTFIEVPNLINDVEIHNWVVKLFSNNEIEKVIIEIGANPITSLQIAYHIRLSIENLKEKALTPVFFVSNLSLNFIMLQTGIYSQILATKGVSFSEFDLESNKIEIEHLKGLNENEYLIKFLKIIHILPDETVGRHSLANIWGAYAMDKASNANTLSTDSEFKKKLYFKYVSAFNNIDKLKPSPLKVLGYINVNEVDRKIAKKEKVKTESKKIKAEGKRILLIDDEASKGWDTVLKKVFKTSSAEDFVVINEKVKNFEAFSENSKRIIESEQFDLYLVDLRLNGLDEDENLKTELFSGMNVMKKIKSLNEGNQVIIFTASNKVWNLKALLDAGADGYYMKESPEYNFARTISEQNYTDFKENILECFSKNYLSDIYTQWKNTKRENTNSTNRFISESNTALDIAWKLIKNNYLDLGFLTLYQALEIYAESVFYYDYNMLGSYKLNDITVIENISNDEREWLLKFNTDTKNGDYFSSTRLIQKRHINPTAIYKTSCLLHLEYQKDDLFLKNFGKLNKLRNDIAHGVKGLTTEKDLIEILRILEEIRSKK